MKRIAVAALLPLFVTLTACGPESWEHDWKPDPVSLPEPIYAPSQGADRVSADTDASSRPGDVARPLPGTSQPQPLPSGALTLDAQEQVARLDASPQAYGTFALDLVRTATKLAGSDVAVTRGTLTAPSVFNPEWTWTPEPQDRLEYRTIRTVTTFQFSRFDLDPALTAGDEIAFGDLDHDVAFTVTGPAESLSISSWKEGFERGTTVKGLIHRASEACEWSLDAKQVVIQSLPSHTVLEEKRSSIVSCPDVKANFAEDRLHEYGATAEHAFDYTTRTLNWEWSGKAGSYLLRDAQIFHGSSSKDGALHTAKGVITRSGFDVGELQSEEVSKLNDRKLRRAVLVGAGIHVPVGTLHLSNY